MSVDEINIEKFDSELFKNIVSYYVLGGYDENEKNQPFLLKIILKNEDDELLNNSINYEEIINKSLYKILDFYSSQSFYYFEKKNDRKVQKFVTRIRVQVFCDMET